MASYRPFHPPPQSAFPPPPPPNQNPMPPPAPPPSTQYQQNWGPHNQSYSQMNPNPNSNYQHFNHAPRNQPQQPQMPPYQPPPPPPPPENPSYPPPPPPAAATSMYFPSSQYSQYSQSQSMQPPPPPPPPSSPPPPPPPSQPSSPPPPPPPSAAAPMSAGKENRHEASKVQHKPPMPPSGQAKRPSGHGPLPGRGGETEEERRLRKKREYENLRREEKQKQQLKESQNKVLQKTQMLSSGVKGGHGSSSASHMGDRRSAPLLSGDRIENRLKKPTTFLCKLKFRNQLPDPSAKIKLLPLKRDPERYTKYQITSLEKNYKSQLYVEPDLGIPLDLLDLSVYNPPKGERLPLDPEDEALLRDDDPITPIKKDGIKRKDRPTDKGVSWLVKTQYISPLSMESTKQSMTEKQAKELREAKDRRLLENLSTREGQLRSIEASFEACKSRPVHATNPQLQPRRILPLLPFVERFEDKFVVANFDSAPTADSEIYGKLDAADRDEHESRALMKSFVASSSDADKPDKFLAYMVPSPDELKKDMHDENEDISYSWIREYHWDVRGDDADDPSTYLVVLGEKDARYVPLPTKLMLRKKRAREGKSTDEVEHFPVPKTITVRNRPNVASRELREEEDNMAGKRDFSDAGNGRVHIGNGSGSRRLSKNVPDDDEGEGEGEGDADHYSGAEDYMSD